MNDHVQYGENKEIKKKIDQDQTTFNTVLKKSLYKYLKLCANIVEIKFPFTTTTNTRKVN